MQILSDQLELTNTMNISMKETLFRDIYLSVYIYIYGYGCLHDIDSYNICK